MRTTLEETYSWMRTAHKQGTLKCETIHHDSSNMYSKEINFGRITGLVYVDDWFSYYVYLKQGKPHRVDGPAILNHLGAKEYWIDGHRYYGDDFLIHPSVIEYKLNQILKTT